MTALLSFHTRNVRVARLPSTVRGAHTIVVRRLAKHRVVRVRPNIRTDRSNLREASGQRSRTLDKEVTFVIRVVDPVEYR